MDYGTSSDHGETIAMRGVGRYRVLEEIGRGAMGVVYRGFDPVIGRTVALKTLSLDPGHTSAPEFRERLYREAAAAGALSHPNIVTIFDIVEDGRVTAVAMEFIDGRSLAAIIGEHAPLPLEAAVDVIAQVCSALDFAGSQGIVHRDIKPANILLTPAGRVKVTDFGVARLAMSTMTHAGTVLGSPSYMSPEQVRGRALDARSDLFSAAIVFFEMVTGERPFAGDDVATTMYRIAHEAPAPPDRFNASIGPDVAAVLARAFAKEPSERFQTGAEFVAALGSAAGLVAGGRTDGALAALAASPPPVPQIVVPRSAESGGMAGSLEPALPPVMPIPAGGAPTPAVLDGDGRTLAPIRLAAVSETPSGIAAEYGATLAPTRLAPAGPGTAQAPLPLVAPPPSRAGRVRSSRVAIVASVVTAVAAVAAAGVAWQYGRAWLALTPSAPAAVEPAIPDPALGIVPPGELVAPGPDATAPSGSAEPAASAPSRPGGTPPPATKARTPSSRTSPLPSQPLQATVPADAVSAPVAAEAVPQPAPAARAGRVYRQTEVDTRPSVTRQVAPAYPDDAARQGIEDVVVLEVLVGTTGRPEDVRVLRGSRKAPSFDAAAAAAVRQWAFEPARKGGSAVACWYNVGVPFALPR